MKTQTPIDGFPSIGNWSASQPYSTNYQAPSDGFVLFRSNGASNNNNSLVTVRGWVGASSPANTFMAGNSFNGPAQSLYCSIIFPVKKGQWYRCTISDSSGSSFFQQYFIPLS